jgi:hypothetical protein
MILEGVHGFTLDTHVQATFCHEISVPILTLPSTIAADDDRINATAITTAAATAGADANANTEDTRLTTYMRLPVEQYVCVPMPLNSKLSRYINTATSSLSEDDDIVSAAANNTTNTTTSHPPTTNDFELIVPPVKFLWLEVQPIIKARVVLEPDRVLIQSHEATLIGSSFISTSKLNERFDFCARAELTWSDGEMDADTDNTEANPGSFVSASSSSSSSKEDEEDEDEIGERVIINHKQKSDSSMTSEGEDEEREQNEYNNNSNTKTTRTTNTPTTSTIYATTSIAVNVDVPNPFRTVVPHRVLVKTGNTAVQLSLQFMIRSFLAGLVTDYKRWVQDAEYRRYRAELSETASSSPSSSQPDQPNTEETIN